MPKSLLPREGLTLEAAFAPIRLTFLQPLLTGSVLLALHQSRSLAAKWPALEVLRELRSPRALIGLGALFAIGVLRKLNKFLSRVVLNNFTTDTTWNWPKEIVIVTEGCGGIGSMMVQRFADKNATVISLDIAPPKTPIACKDSREVRICKLTFAN
jgi:all-trans-retinol dehydrogenase (NAD+)